MPQSRNKDGLQTLRDREPKRWILIPHFTANSNPLPPAEPNTTRYSPGSSGFFGLIQNASPSSRCRVTATAPGNRACITTTSAPEVTRIRRSLLSTFSRTRCADSGV
ncbi:conserved domain protein [Acidobacterium capsulatum ATCC 51196]|uniref:Conserved domain protein n=1 Tax=Acidobacterium capsulatum (strain ATCC 51196 / DSM 11244 / BCRC 80197 / JCM 7670 / NBRC 15755 / NCIMB 13165 / 161) TaxID=240015 RepID=C1F7F3_ACIC5|nr:conserved domain protein [Acidobacterium capsulatum ATCC 51196]